MEKGVATMSKTKKKLLSSLELTPLRIGGFVVRSGV